MSNGSSKTPSIVMAPATSPNSVNDAMGAPTNTTDPPTVPINDVASSKTCKTFPQKLHEMLEETDKAGCTEVVSWASDGKSFKVHIQ